MAIVGSSVVVGKVLVERLPVFVIGGLRFALASVILVPLALGAGGLPAVRGRDLGVLALQSASGIFAFNALLLAGLALTSAAEGGIVTSTTPAVAAVLATLALGEAWTLRRTGAVALAVAGLLVINALAPADRARGAAPALGNALVFAAVVCEAIFLVCSRVLAQRWPPLPVATGISVLGFAMFLPPALWQARHVDLAAVRLADWLAIAYYGIVVTVVAFLLWARGVRDVQAGTAAVFTGLLPVSAVSLAYLVLGEPVLWSHLAGGALVLAAILLVAPGTDPPARDSRARIRPPPGAPASPGSRDRCRPRGWRAGAPGPPPLRTGRRGRRCRRPGGPGRRSAAPPGRPGARGR